MNEKIQKINLPKLFSNQLIGIVPPILLVSGFLTSWVWNSNQLPLLLNFPPTYLFFNFIIFVGTLYHLKNSGLTVFSYSWIVFSLYGIASMSEIYVIRILTMNNALLSERNSVSIIIELNSLLWILIAIGIATYIVKRNFYHLIFFMGLFSAASVPGFPMIVGENLPDNATIATSICAVMAILGTGSLSIIILKASNITNKIAGSWKIIVFLFFLILFNPILKLLPILLLTTDIPIFTLDIWLQIIDEQLHSIWPIGAAIISGGVYLATRPQRG
ncbi:MAG: hypothetical protein CL785_01405 [Chloroflexi bacterium]|nr:hypothetical protein [Chloroflexota bacterium]